MGKSESTKCPSCGITGRPVQETTLCSLLREEFRGEIDGKSWHFCTAPDCPLACFEAGGATFHKDQLTVRVGIKERP